MTIALCFSDYPPNDFAFAGDGDCYKKTSELAYVFDDIVASAQNQTLFSSQDCISQCKMFGYKFTAIEQASFCYCLTGLEGMYNDLLKTKKFYFIYVILA